MFYRPRLSQRRSRLRRGSNNFYRTIWIVTVSFSVAERKVSKYEPDGKPPSSTRAVWSPDLSVPKFSSRTTVPTELLTLRLIALSVRSTNATEAASVVGFGVVWVICNDFLLEKNNCVPPAWFNLVIVNRAPS